MAQYKSQLEKKYKWLMLLAILMPAVIVVVFMVNIQKISVDHVKDFIVGMQSGVFIGIESSFITRLVRIKKLLNNPEKLKESYIVNNDERNILVAEKSSKTHFTLSVFLLGIATIITGFFNQTVFITLGLTLVTSCCLMGALFYYYNKRL